MVRMLVIIMHREPRSRRPPVPAGFSVFVRICSAKEAKEYKLKSKIKSYISRGNDCFNARCRKAP